MTDNPMYRFKNPRGHICIFINGKLFESNWYKTKSGFKSGLRAAIRMQRYDRRYSFNASWRTDYI